MVLKMGGKINLFNILLIAVLMVNFRAFVRSMATVAKTFEANGVVPDVIPKAPAAKITVSWSIYSYNRYI